MELYLPTFMISLILLVGVPINYNKVLASMAPPEMYWKNVLPNTPMPSAIRNSLVGNQSKKSPFRASKLTCPHCRYINAATQKQVDDYIQEYGETYTLETQIIPGKIIDVRLKSPSGNKATFLPHDSRNSVPFSSNKLPEIVKKLSIRPRSNEAAAIEETLKGCEESHEGESKLCVTSLQSMVSFVTSRLGNRVSPVSSTSIDKDGKIKYKINWVKKLVDYGSPTVVCHKEEYPYAVFSCHQVDMTSAYVVSLVGGDGISVKAAAVCHKDTSWWSPKHVSFQVLNVKPGKTSPVCHFLDDLAVIWTKK